MENTAKAEIQKSEEKRNLVAPYNAQNAIQYDPLAPEIMKKFIANEYTEKEAIAYALEGCDLCRKGIAEFENNEEKDMNPYLEFIKITLPQKLQSYEDVIQKITASNNGPRIKIKPEFSEKAFIRVISLLNSLSEKRMPDSFWGDLFESTEFSCTVKSIHSVRHDDQDETRDFLQLVLPHLPTKDTKKKT
ncbi:hypothetical protein K7J14_12425 [Treponema zuelzerae]|uniref:Uncharacterized protein n=1 Tax=Teretinema zuelzerae TaxID=156 RepID=A0AAE3EJM4_9SPIR|nr:hypothetical protein [Teretinema zuelzerae]MCD1655500.1 hypothetical protein [Teretinema zuelzerae]